MMYDLTIREEELKNKVATDYFSDFDNTKIIGNVDFCIAVPTDKNQREIFEQESLLWAEAKKGNKQDIYASLVQLILTIGKARTFDKNLPPAFLGAFDAEKIAFIQYNAVLDVFYQNDFNWTITPSDHESNGFKQVYSLVKDILTNNMLIFHFGTDDKELHRFIKTNFIVGKSRLSKIRINKNNFVNIYNKWLTEVKPTISVNWDIAKKSGIIDAYFYLADILSEHNVTLKQKLYVLLRDDHYEIDRKLNEMGMFSSQEAQFKDSQKAHTQFWNRYNRPPKREYWDYIVERSDLLVPQDVRERKGSFFTPQQWVELSQQYIADTIGEDWQDEYTVWDCCAGTGNLLAGLTNKYNIWASTLDQADVDVMKDRIENGANLLESHVFQFDFLNDNFTKLPKQLQDIINDAEKRKKLVIYINPPYAEAGNKQKVTGNGEHKTGVAVKMATYSKYLPKIGIAGRELFAQFLTKIYFEIPSCVLANFSKLKNLQAPNFSDFRQEFRASLEKIFLVPADTFDNVKGQFPIGFFIWNTDKKEEFKSIEADVYNSHGEFIKTKHLFNYDKLKTLTQWTIETRNRTNERKIGYMTVRANDVQHINYNYILNDTSTLPNPRGSWVTDKNLIELSIYTAVLHTTEADWLNDRDQFLYPNDGWQTDKEFQTDCLAYTLFNNNIQSKQGVNHWIPFTETEVDAQEKFASHFMTDFIEGKASCRPIPKVESQMLSLPFDDSPQEQQEQQGASTSCAQDGGKMPLPQEQKGASTYCAQSDGRMPSPQEQQGASTSCARNDGRMPSTPPFFNENDTKRLHRTGNLPHWHQNNKLIFVTFRLADSLPQEKLDEWRNEQEAWTEQHPKPWDKNTEAEYHKRFGGFIDKWLDANHGSCVLRKEVNRQIVENALRAFDGERYTLHAYTIMPNHVHALFQLSDTYTLESIMHSWKSFTAKEINKAEGTTGQLWQAEYFDRLIRDEEHYVNVTRYILKQGVGTSCAQSDGWMPLPQEQHGTSTSCAQNDGRIPSPLEFSPAARNVMDTGRELWKYYHVRAYSDSPQQYNVNASLYDIREYFQGRNDKGKMNAASTDERYNELIAALRQSLKTLAKQIEPKVYEYGFLKA